jgi:signal transduction histidine kinase
MISLRQHLTRTVLGTALVLVSVGLAALYWAAREAVIDQFDVALRAKAQVVETLTARTPEGPKIAFPDRFFPGFDTRRPRDFFELWAGAGGPIARSQSLGHQDLSPPFPLGPKFAYWSVHLPTGRHGRALGLIFAPGPNQTATLVVASDRTELDEDLRSLILLCAGSAIALYVVMIWLIPRALRRGLAPLDRLGEQAAAIDSSSLAVRFSVADLPEELRPIAGRLNDLLARIEQSFERERRFSADLAHELRTPLAELRTAAECAVKWPDARDPALDRETVMIAAQMEGIVTHLLALARSEQGQLKVRREPVALHALVAERWERLTARAENADRTEPRLPSPTVELELQPATVHADPALLRSIIDNLLENAVEYASPPRRIRIATAAGVLRITNSAADLAADDLPLLFERFWRKEAARSGGLHVGLGLPLSRAFAEAIGWRLEARLAQPQVLEMTLAEN